MYTFIKSLSFTLLSTIGVGMFAFQNLDISNNKKHVAEDVSTSSDEPSCAHDHLLQLELQKDKSLKAKMDQAEAQYQSFAMNPTESVVDFTLPVVFHIVHENGAENIPDTQVEDALQSLNDAYDLNLNHKIQFCLAKTGPDGNPHPGITRTESPLTEVTIETEDLALKSLIQWDPTQYINIYIVRQVGSTSLNTQVTGYAYQPTFHGTAKDGVVIEAAFVTDVPDNSYLVHHLGHYLGLYHTYEGGCLNDDCLNDGDKVCDTPPDWTVALPPCDVTVNSCYTDVNLSDPNNPFATDQNDLRDNFMDWSPVECYTTFTNGQLDRMRFFIEGARASLLTSMVCNNACDDPITEFMMTPSDTIIPFNTQLALTASAVGATDFEWYVDGTLIGNGPVLPQNFGTLGSFTVTVIAVNGNPDCNISLTSIIDAVDCYGNAHVDDGAGLDVPMCGGIGNPCKTIQYALDNIVCSGDTVFIHSGTYSLAAGVNEVVPIAKIPEDYSVTFLGVENNGPVLIDGASKHRAFEYRYAGGTCPDDSPDNGIAVTQLIAFENLTIQNCKITDRTCPDGAIRTNGGAMNIVGNYGSDITLRIDDCRFFNNIAEVFMGSNSDGRSTTGGAIYFNGRVDVNAPAGTGGRIFISNSEFSSNRAERNDNGGQGGAMYLVNCDTTNISGTYFCNNTVFSTDADNGDLDFDRNAGGAIAIADNFDLASPNNHQYVIDDCFFMGNSATTTNGGTFANQSEGGAIFIAKGTNSGPIPPFTSANLVIGNSSFYDNNNELVQEDFATALGATIDINGIGNNIFQPDPFMFSLGNDTTICNIDSITIGMQTVLPSAFYEWNTGQNTPTITVSDTGLYVLTITLGACSVSDEIQINEIICGEVCGNGIDDDGNGLIDCYDPACCADGMCNDQYYNVCPDDCVFTTPVENFAAERKWTSEDDFTTFGTPITGDLDNDGVPEILIHQGGTTGDNQYSILNGATGQQEVVLNLSAIALGSTVAAIADVDNDGSGEIFIYGEGNSTIHRFEHDGSLSATAQITGGAEFPKAVNIVDFNADGEDEIYLGNVILDATTLATEVILPTSLANTNVGVAAEILPDAACSTCDGLELVVGNVVYAIDIATGGAIPFVENTGMPSGLISLGDIDGDGDVDGVVSVFDNSDPVNSGVMIYGWDLQTTTALGQYVPADNASPSTLADIDGDGNIEIVFKTASELIALENDFSLKWMRAIVNPGFNMNSSVAFDFDGDGDYEIVDQDSEALRVLDGTNGVILYEDGVLSRGAFQNPVVADVDADGLTEIVISGATTNIGFINNLGRVIVYGSDSFPWQTTRRIWNQFNYFNVQVQDDLALPMHQQQHHLISALNNFRTQHGEQIGSDASITEVMAQCRLDEIDLIITICNTGTNNLPASTPITFYTANPTNNGSASVLDTEFLQTVLPPDSCIVRTITIPAQYVDPVYIVVNDDGSTNTPFNLATQFPNTPIGECDYTNNMANFVIEIEPFELDLGPDLFVCDGASVELDATDNFVSYEWQDGSTEQTFTTEDGGEYWVTVVDSCGGIQTDTVFLTVDPNTVNMTEPANAVICPTQDVQFEVMGDFDTYQWRPEGDGILSCDTCQNPVAVNVTEPLQYIVTASNSVTGCYSVDTVQISLTSIQTTDDAMLCIGGEIIVHGQTVTMPGVYEQMFTSFEGCDSTSTVTVTNFAPVVLGFTTVPTCPQGSIGSATANISNGVATNYIWSTNDTGPTISNVPAGIYTLTITDGNGCTQEGSVEVEEINSVNIQTDFVAPTCEGGSDGQLEILNTQPGWMYSLDGGIFQASQFFDGLSAGTYDVAIQDGDCVYSGTGVVDDPAGIQIGIADVNLVFPGMDTSTVTPTIISNANIVSYSWSPSAGLSCDDCFSPTVSTTTPTTYTLTVVDENGCTGVGTLIVNVEADCDLENVMIPNVFTPDNDDNNDDFGAYVTEGFEEVLEMRIYNRWGVQVFESAGNPNTRWDGMHNDKPAPRDVYVYVIRLGCSVNPDMIEPIIKSGDVTLIR